jgi:hypothetical protein
LGSGNSFQLAPRVASRIEDNRILDVYRAIAGDAADADPTPTSSVPDDFSFQARTGVPLQAPVISDPITISGLSSQAPIDIEAGYYSIDGGPFTGSAGSVSNGQQIRVMVLTNDQASSAFIAQVTIGGKTGSFSATTTNEAPESFLGQVDAPINTTLDSNTLTITEDLGSINLSITGGFYSINGGDPTNEDQTVTLQAGDTITLSLTSSDTPLTTTTAVLTLGEDTVDYSVTTGVFDLEPDYFDLGDATTLEAGAVIESNIFTISGIDSLAPISISGGEYSIVDENPDRVWTNDSGFVANGDQVLVRGVAQQTNGEQTVVVLDIGGMTTTFTILTTTAPLDITSSPTLASAEGSSYVYQVTATGGTGLSYSLSNEPSGMLINTTTGLIEWSEPVIGEYSITVTVSNAEGSSAQQTYNLVITPALPPVTSQGTDFWFMYNVNLGQSEFLLYIASQRESNVVVEIPGLQYEESFLAQANEVLTVDLSEAGISTEIGTRGIGENGIHVTSDQPVAVYLINKIRATTDASIVFPTKALGNEYSVATYSQSSNNFGSLFGIVATEDNTVVDITPSIDFSEDDVSRVRGETFQITLNQGQTYQAIADNNLDFSGTLISSDKPIALLAGNQCTAIVTASACDHLIEQITPIPSLGSTYMTIPLATRRNGDTVRVYATENDTFVSINDDIAYYLQAGEYYTTIIDGPSNISANRPIQVMQFSNSSSYDNVTSDPFMLGIPPKEQFVNYYLVTTPADDFANNFINLVVRSVASSSVRVDGAAVDESLWQAIPGTDYVGAQIAVGLGTHTASASEPFGLYIYGYASFDSYGYTGGMAFSGAEIVDQIDLSVSTTSPEVGSEVCVNATVLDSDSNPISQAQVKFSVIHESSSLNKNFTDLTNTDGLAEFCYDRSLATSDFILVSATQEISANATVNWQAYTGNENLSPQIESLPEMYVNSNQPYSYQVIASDPNNDALSYSLIEGPEGMAIDSVSGIVSWEPGFITSGAVYPVSISVSDGQDNVDQQNYNLIGTLPL